MTLINFLFFTTRCTSMYGVPTMFIDMLNHRDFDSFDLSSLYTGVMAGSPCPVETLKQVISRMNMDRVTVRKKIPPYIVFISIFKFISIQVCITGKLLYLEHRYLDYHASLKVRLRSQPFLLYIWFKKPWYLEHVNLEYLIISK